MAFRRPPPAGREGVDAYGVLEPVAWALRLLQHTKHLTPDALSSLELQAQSQRDVCAFQWPALGFRMQDLPRRVATTQLAVSCFLPRQGLQVLWPWNQLEARCACGRCARPLLRRGARGPCNPACHAASLAGLVAGGFRRKGLFRELGIGLLTQWQMFAWSLCMLSHSGRRAVLCFKIPFPKC